MQTLPAYMQCDEEHSFLTHSTDCNTLQHTATYCKTLQHTLMTKLLVCLQRDEGVEGFLCLQHVATYCNTLQHTTTRCNTPQHTATHCNTRLHMSHDCGRKAYLTPLASFQTNIFVHTHIRTHTHTHTHTRTLSSPPWIQVTPLYTHDGYIYA